MNYQDFIQSKKHNSIDFGIKSNFLPDQMFDFQKHVAEFAIKKGRTAIFLDTGLGKTIIELTIAKNYVNYTNKPVLIITPLAVAEQHLREAEKFGIDDVEHTKDGKFSKKIILLNYERLNKLNPSDFDCVILDESSILKHFDGATKAKLTQFMRRVKYRFLATATPSPNDYIELGTSSEALGYMGYMDMLGKFFRNNNNSVDPKHIGSKWYLKPHAENDFWRWVASWSISAKYPSDLGFSDELHKLPELYEVSTIIRNNTPLPKGDQLSMFSLPAVNFFDIKKEVRATLNQRCEMAVEKASKYDTSVYWCNLNDESKLLSELDKNAVEIIGSMNIDKKEDILKNFSNGNIKKLITKSSMTSFGLNWQHCNHTTYFPTYSYEQYYQSIRRFWRFGQTKEVFVDLIISDGQEKILQTLMIKKEQAIKMFKKLTKQTNKEFIFNQKEFNQKIELPKFL